MGNDLISRETLLEIYCDNCSDYGRCRYPCVSYDLIVHAPAIDVEPVRHGRWIGLEYDGYADGCPVYDLWECSECGHEHKGEDTPNYCPNCGAKMDGDINAAD